MPKTYQCKEQNVQFLMSLLQLCHKLTKTYQFRRKTSDLMILNSSNTLRNCQRMVYGDMQIFPSCQKTLTIMNYFVCSLKNGRLPGVTRTHKMCPPTRVHNL